MNDDIDLNNRTKDFGKSVKNKTKHLYTRIASDVQKVVNTKRNGNPFSVEEHHYMTVYPGGRLGNQLFQYAVLYAVTRTNHTWIPVMMEDNNLDLLQNTFRTSLSIRVENYSFTNYTTVTAGVDADTTVKVLNNLPKVNITLDGYFESHKYFSHVKDDLRLELIFPRPIQDEVFKYFNSVTPVLWKEERFVRVGIHVRRTDQITEERQTMGFIPQPPSYFIHAMEYFRQEYNRVQFIVTSDDLAWCKENILDEHIEFSTHNYTMDLAILSLSDHIIISLGTYSWWAGWLCKGTTIYYGVMPPNDTYLGKVYNNNSCVPVPDDEYNKWLPVI